MRRGTAPRLVMAPVPVGRCTVIMVDADRMKETMDGDERRWWVVSSGYRWCVP